MNKTILLAWRPTKVKKKEQKEKRRRKKEK
jgi:hypothetical protein